MASVFEGVTFATILAEAIGYAPVEMWNKYAEYGFRIVVEDGKITNIVKEKNADEE